MALSDVQFYTELMQANTLHTPDLKTATKIVRVIGRQTPRPENLMDAALASAREKKATEGVITMLGTLANIQETATSVQDAGEKIHALNNF